MIETKEEYEFIARQVQGGRDWTALNETIEALRKVARAARAYRDSHTMEGANKDSELLMDFTARIVAERARIDEGLAALPDWITDEQT